MAMRISTKGRYALRVMIDLAERHTDSFVPLQEIAERQEISEKYLESILSGLTKKDYLVGQRGKGGGYKLARDPDTISVGDVLRTVEGSLAPAACLAPDAEPCPRAPECRTLPMWKKFYEMTNDYFDGISIADLAADGHGADFYVI